MSEAKKVLDYVTEHKTYQKVDCATFVQARIWDSVQNGQDLYYTHTCTKEDDHYISFDRAVVVDCKADVHVLILSRDMVDISVLDVKGTISVSRDTKKVIVRDFAQKVVAYPGTEIVVASDIVKTEGKLDVVVGEETFLLIEGSADGVPVCCTRRGDASTVETDKFFGTEMAYSVCTGIVIDPGADPEAELWWTADNKTYYKALWSDRVKHLVDRPLVVFTPFPEKLFTEDKYENLLEGFLKSPTLFVDPKNLHLRK